ncbi:hypothetical protein Q9189_000167 [Teloschistes chrysophthalmus]
MPKPTRRPQHPPSSTQPSRSPISKTPKPKRPYHHPTLYAATAGRISTRGPTAQPRYSTTRDTPTSSTLPLPPEEILFARRNAPERYEEDDFYWANRELKEEGREVLPDSELLKGVHEYVSAFYGRVFGVGEGGRGGGGGEGGGKGIDFKSMDGTALMCLGVLLEEAAEGVLGETGDLVFVEGAEEVGEGDEGVWEGEGEEVVGKGIGGGAEARDSDEESDDTGERESSDAGRARKRRKLRRESEASEPSV